jgi:hypothetical protein
MFGSALALIHLPASGENIGNCFFGGYYCFVIGPPLTRLEVKAFCLLEWNASVASIGEFCFLSMQIT